jgi:cobalt-zinc-cadmium efflux system outer membrane protein
MLNPNPFSTFIAAVVLTTALYAESAPQTEAGASTSELAAVVSAAPSLAAARARAEAARARLGSAGRFPDPEIEGMLSRKNTREEVMPMWEITVRQPLPKAGERAADRDRAGAVMAMAEAEFTLMAGEMTTDVAMALAEAETARNRVTVLNEQIARTERVLASVDARLATGQGRLGDRLVLQTRIAAMQLMVERDIRMAEDAVSEVRGRLGLKPDATLPVFAAPRSEDISIDQAAALTLANAKAIEARAMGRMARASAKPMTAVGLRFEREEESMGNVDTIGIAFMTELPWRGRRYARADERAAQAEANASLAEADAAKYRIAAAISRVERARRLAATARRLAEETQSRLDAEYDTLVRAAGAGGMSNDSTVLMILEVLEKNTEAQLQVIDAEGSARVAQAELWRYVPARFFPAL